MDMPSETTRRRSSQGACLKRRDFLRTGALLGAGLALGVLDGCAGGSSAGNSGTDTTESTGDADAQVARGSQVYRGFILDNVLHAADEDDVHFNIHIPDSYDGTREVALFVTLPGRQGHYFQGVGANIRTEDFAFESQGYDGDMIVLAPQLNDWQESSARQTIALVEWMLGAYAIDRQRVYLEGYSDGGETLSYAMGMRPELFTRALLCASAWYGDLETLAAARGPVYMAIGEADECYGADPTRQAAARLAEMYAAQGLSAAEIDALVKLDVKPAAYFEEGSDAGGDAGNQHGSAPALFCRDPQIMGWLFSV